MFENVFSRGKLAIVLPLILFVVLALICTFPLVIHPNSTLAAPTNGDVSNSVGYYESIVLAKANPFFTNHVDTINYPNGFTINTGVDRVSFLSVVILWMGSKTIGAIQIHSIEAITAYIFTAFFAFFLARKITGSNAAAAVAGLVFGFSTHMLSIVRADGTYGHMWLLLLPVWAFWTMITARDTKFWRVILAALSVFPAIFWTPYFALHVMVIAASCFIVGGFYMKRKTSLTRTLFCLALIAMIWLMALSVYRYIGLHSPQSSIPTRSTQDAYQQAAHPLMYLLPGYYSWWGHAEHQWLVNAVPGSNGINLYVGISTLILALTGMIATWRAHDLMGRKYLKPAVTMLSVALLMCFLFSLAPKIHILGLTIPTPNEVVVSIMPALRAGQRFVMPIMGVLALLASVGAYFIFSKFKGNTRLVVVALVLIIVGLDIWGFPGQAATTFPKSKALSALRAQPDGVVVGYKDKTMLAFPNQIFCMIQTQDNKPMVNDCGLARQEPVLQHPELRLDLVDSHPYCQQLRFWQHNFASYLIVWTDQVDLYKPCFQSWYVQPPIIGQDRDYTIYNLKTAKAPLPNYLAN